MLKEEKGMALVTINDTVKVHYIGKLNDGGLFDAYADREPLEFTLGDGRIIPESEAVNIPYLRLGYLNGPQPSSGW